MREDLPHVAVIGSGPCGAMAASQLHAAGVRVTLLESGQRRSPGLVVRARGNTIARYMPRHDLCEGGHLAASDPNTVWYWSHAHGGLSNFWTGAVPRFHPLDFTEGGELDDRYRWPVSYNDLEPFYDVAEAALVVTASGRSAHNLPANTVRHVAPIPADWGLASQRLSASGMSLLPQPMAKGQPWMAARRGTEFNSFESLVRPLIGTRHFDFVSGAHARSVGWNPGMSRVDHVEYVDRATGRVENLPVDAVVLAAGTINTIKLLFASRSGDFPDGLGNAHDLLGRYVHDHPRQWTPFSIREPMTLPHHPLYLSRADYADSDPLMGASCTIGLARQRDRLATYVSRRGTELAVQVFGSMIPTEETRVVPSDSVRDDLGDPVPQIALSYDDAALANVDAALQRLAHAFASFDNPVEIPPDLPELVPGSSVHYGGGVRMHESPEFGVLDRWNRVHDALNVVVADASCFTTGPEKNPTLTAMALAARAGQHLGCDLLS